MREPIATGFYEDNFDALEKQITECFKHKLGPGDLPIKKRDKKLKAVIVPHAGYSYSGPCAAWAYKEIAESEFPKTFILLGPTHRSNKSGISLEDWKTPFGIVKTDKELAIKIKENTELEIDEETHTDEHSIEVQLPFLQFVNKDKLSNLKIVAIAITNDIDYRKLANDLNKITKDKKIVFIVSSDFTHYGPDYGYVPFSSDIKERLENLDKEAFNHIKNLNADGFADFINKSGATICGFMPILLLLEMLEKAKVEVLLYYTSAALTGDERNSVSYASITFR